MSEISTLVTEGHFSYIAAHTVQEDGFLRELKREARAAGIPPIWISPEQASFMQILLKLAKAREVIEVGTLAGYSAIAMARALPQGGRVRTIEISEVHAAFAEQWIARSDVAGRVEVHRGAGKDVLPGFAADSADAAFLDADKASYPLYLRESLRIVRRGGLILVDNAFAFGQLFDDRPADREVGAVRAFNEYMNEVQGLHSIIVPIGDGLWVGVKLLMGASALTALHHGDTECAEMARSSKAATKKLSAENAQNPLQKQRIFELVARRTLMPP